MARGHAFSQTSQLASKSAAARAIEAASAGETPSFAAPEGAVSLACQRDNVRSHSDCSRSLTQSPISSSAACGKIRPRTRGTRPPAGIFTQKLRLGQSQNIVTRTKGRVIAETGHASVKELSSVGHMVTQCEYAWICDRSASRLFSDSTGRPKLGWAHNSPSFFQFARTRAPTPAREGLAGGFSPRRASSAHSRLLAVAHGRLPQRRPRLDAIRLRQGFHTPAGGFLRVDPLHVSAPPCAARCRAST